MTKFITRLPFPVCLLIFLYFTGAVSNAETPLERGQKLLDGGKYAEAYKFFSDLIVSNTGTAEEPTYLFYKAKSAYYADMFKESRDDFNRLIGDRTQSAYIPYAYFFLGNAQYRLHREDDALAAYLDAYRFSSDRQLDKLALKSIEAAVASSHSVILEKISIAAVPETKICGLVLALARGLMVQNNYQSVQSILSSCSDPEAVRISREAGEMLRQQTVIGMVLPLSGELQKYGESLLDGAMLMAKEYGRETGGKIMPVVYDTKGASMDAARIVKRLIASGAAAAIGPLTSEETAVASAMLSCSDLPLIAPAASQGGLTELSSTCYQLQPTLDRQGTKMAEFAFRKLRFDTTAIITPTTPDNLRMAEAFASRFKELGGTILGVEYFRPRETDFGSLIIDLKSLAFKRLSDSAIFVNESGDTLEAKEVPVRLESIYIPADADQLQLLLPQINFYNLNASYLGGEGWGDKVVYMLGREATKICYFTSGRIGDTANVIQRQFAADFNREYGRDPGYLEALGYDAMALLCQALKAGNYSRFDIARYLLSVDDYKGAAGNVSFGAEHENLTMPIFMIEAGRPRQIEYKDR